MKDKKYLFKGVIFNNSIYCISLPSPLGITVGDMSAEEQELTQLLCESLLVSDSQVSPEGEEAALNACSRLRNTVCTLLELLNHANTQVWRLKSFKTYWINCMSCNVISGVFFFFFFLSSWRRLMMFIFLWRKSSLRAEKTQPSSLSSTSSWQSSLSRRRSSRVNSSWSCTRPKVNTTWL